MRALVRTILCAAFLAVAAIAATAAPNPTSITPASGSTSGNEFVTIGGTGFVATPTVTIGGVSCTSVVFVSSTSITCVTGAHAAGLVNVVVTNPDTTNGTLSNGFTYRAVAPVCLITGTAFNPDNTLAINQIFRVSRILLNGRLIAQGPFTYITDSNGVIFNAVPSGNTFVPGSTQGIIIQQGAIASIYSTIPPWNSATAAGVLVTVPVSPTADLGSLGTVASVPTAGMTVQNAGTPLTNKEGTLNFNTGLTATETTPGVVRIDLTAGAIRWDQLGNPTNPLTLNMGTQTTAFTWGVINGGSSEARTFGALTGSPTVNQFSIIDTTVNTNLGALVNINSVGSSTALPLKVTAQGTANGFKVDTGGILRALGTGGLDAAALVTGITPAARGGTGVSNGFTITLAGNLVTSGAFNTTLTVTNTTNVTLPPSGTLVNSAVATLSSLASIGTITTGVWQGTPVGTQWGGLGANESAASGVLSLNAGTVVNNAITTNGIPYGTAGNTLTFATAVNNAVLVTSAGGVPSLAATGSSLSVSGSVLNAIQDIRTSSVSFQVAAIGINGAAPASGFGELNTGGTLNTQASGTVATAELDALFNPSTNLTAEYPVLLIKPTLNGSGASAGRTIVWQRFDSVDTGLVGLPDTSLFFVKATRNSGSTLWSVNGAGNMVVGTITGGAYNKVTVTPPATSSTLTIADGKVATFSSTLTLTGVDSKTLTVNKNLTLDGTDGKTLSLSNTMTLAAGADSQTFTFPSASDTVATLAAAQALTNKGLGSGTSVTAAISFTAGVRQTFAPNATTPGLNVGSVAGDPSTPIEGDLWVDSTGHNLRYRTNGSTISLGAGGGSGTPGGASGTVQYNNSSSFGGMTEFSYSSPALTVTKNALNATLTDVLILQNVTAATSSQNQVGPSFHLSSTVWDKSLASPASILVDTRVQEDNLTYSAVTVSTTTGNGVFPIQITTSAGHGLVTGNKVTVVGVGGNTNANGTYTVLVTDSTHFTALNGATGNGNYTSGGSVARPAVGWMEVSPQINAGGYNTLAGFTSYGGLFLNSSAPTNYAVPLQVNGPIYATSGVQAFPYNQMAQSGTPLNPGFVDYQFNITNTQNLGSEVGMAINMTPTTSTPLGTVAATNYVALYTAITAGANNTEMWGANFLTLSVAGRTVTTWGVEVDMGNNTGSDAPNPGTIGHIVGISVVAGQGANHISAYYNGVAPSVGAASPTPKFGLQFSGLGYITGSKAFDITTNINVDYGLDMNGATINTSMARGPYGTTLLSARNQAGAADIPLIQLGSLGSGTNTLLMGAAATVTTTTSPLGGFWSGATSIGNVVNGVGVWGFQASDGGFTTIYPTAVAAFPSIIFIRANGGSGSGLTAVASGDVLGQVRYDAYDGTAMGTGARFRAVAAENWTNVPAHGAHLTAFTTPNGTSTPIETVRFMSMGPLQISNNAAYAAAVGPVTGDMVGGSQAAVAFYVHGNKFVIAYNRAGTMRFLTYDLAAGTGTWADGTVAP